jgi:hypothetical protein
MNLAASVIGRSDRVVGYGSSTAAATIEPRGSYTPLITDAKADDWRGRSWPIADIRSRTTLRCHILLS